MASFECQVPGWLGQNKNSKQIKFYLDNKRQIWIGEIVDAEPQQSHDLRIKREAEERWDGLAGKGTCCTNLTTRVQSFYRIIF